MRRAMGPTIFIYLSAVWCANAARLRRTFAKQVKGRYPGTPNQPVDQYSRFPYPIKKLGGSAAQENIVEPDMISNAIRTAPINGVKAGPSVRAGDGWVTFRQGPGAYNATGSYDLKCCTICAPENECKKMRCMSVCKKFCGPACVVPSKADDRTIVDHMVKGYENMHSVAVAKEIQRPTDAWARAALGPISITGPAENGASIIPVGTDVKPKENAPEEKRKEKAPEEKPKEKAPVEKPKENAPEEKPKEKAPVEKAPVEKPKEKAPVEKPKEKAPVEKAPEEKSKEKTPGEKPKEKEVLA